MFPLTDLSLYLIPLLAYNKYNNTSSLKARGPVSATAAPVRGIVSQTADVKQLEEAKKTLEGQLKEIRLQLETDGYNTMAQMRCIFVSEILRKLKYCCFFTL